MRVLPQTWTLSIPWNISYLSGLFRIVFKTSHLRCNDTIQVDNATPSIYISIAASPWDPGTASVASALPQPTAVPFSSSCPLQFKTGPGQRINFTLFSLGHYYDFVEPTDVVDTWDPKSCPANVFITDAGRKYTSSLCRAHQREQHLYTTNASLTSLHFSKLQRMQTSIARKTTYILKVEGRSPVIRIDSSNSFKLIKFEKEARRCSWTRIIYEVLYTATWRKWGQLDGNEGSARLDKRLTRELF